MTDTPGVIGPKKIPDEEHVAHWDRLIYPEGLKEGLVNQILIELKHRSSIPVGACPMHGLLLLTGPPGTGKTTLAKAAASKAASIAGGGINFLEVEPHGITSSAMGKTQQRVQELFQVTIAEYADQGPLIVLIDEAETLAADRQKLSLDANPVDIHRATDAVLTSLDLLAVKHPNLLFIATTNFDKALDEAFVSRADFVQFVDLPDRDAATAILTDTLEQLGQQWKGLTQLTKDSRYDAVAPQFHGLDGRKIRKLVMQACASNKESAMDPGKLTLKQLETAVQTAKEVRQ